MYVVSIINQKYYYKLETTTLSLHKCQIIYKIEIFLISGSNLYNIRGQLPGRNI